MADRIVYAICADDGKFETMTKEDILAAIEQALERGYVADPSGAVFSRIKEIRAGQCEQLWVGTEAQFNALNPAPKYGNSMVRVGEDGVLYICSDDALFAEIDNHIIDKNNPHGVTAEQAGALPYPGKKLDGMIAFADGMNGFEWKTKDGTLFRMRPYSNGNLMQITVILGDTELPAFNIENDGSVWLGKPLPLSSGGFGGADAFTARENIGAAAADHTHKPSDIGAYPETGGVLRGNVDFGATMNAVRWTTVDGTQFAIRPYYNGNLFQITRTPPGGVEVNAFSIDNDGNIDFGAGALAVKNGGTGARDAAKAREALGITPENIGAIPVDGGTVTGGLRIDTLSTSGGGVLINEDGEGGTIVITSKSGTYNYEIDAVSDNVIRIHNASSHPDGWKSISWNADDGYLTTDGIALTKSGRISSSGSENREYRVTTANGDIAFCVENNRGVYDYANNKWVVSAGRGSADWTFNGKAQGIVGTEIQVGVAAMVVNGVNVTFPEPFSGIPVVVASNSTRAAAVMVRNITATGCNIMTGDVGDMVQWQAIYKA